MEDIFWTDDVIWSDNPYYWNHVVELTLTTDINGYVDMRRRQQQKQYPSKKQYKKQQPSYQEEIQYITLVCIIDDERFEKTKYIDKKIYVEMLGGEFLITDAKHVPNIKTEDVQWRMAKSSNNDIKITVSNIQVI
jgi:hypothetical protein